MVITIPIVYLVVTGENQNIMSHKLLCVLIDKE